MKRTWSFLICAVALAACHGLDATSESAVALYLDNAARYYETGHFVQAYQQWDQALALDPSNESARLGQAMTLYQMGCEESTEAIQKLADAEARLDALRHENFDGREWKAELGYALVQQRWCDLYDRKIRKLDADAKKGVFVDPKERGIAGSEFQRHLAAMEASYHKVLDGQQREPTDRLTCWLGLARAAAWKNDLETALKYARLYEDSIDRSKALWEKSAKQYPDDAARFDEKLVGAEIQEVELRDLMGNVLFKLGRIDEAEVELSKVIKLSPSRGPAYLNRGIVRQTRGDFDLARGDFRKFLVLTNLPENDPTILEATKRLAEVQQKLDAEESHATPAAAPAPGR